MTTSGRDGWLWKGGVYTRPIRGDVSARITWQRDYRWQILKGDKVIDYGIVSSIREAFDMVEQKIASLP